MRIDALRKISCSLAFLLIAAAMVMSHASSFEHANVPVGMNSPGIAMELPESDGEVKGLASDSADQQTFWRLQRLDQWMFIPAYVLFFWSAGLYAFLTPGWTKWFGLVIIVLVSSAAVFDYREDGAILYALGNLNDPHAGEIAWAAYWKWGLLYALLVCFVPVLLRRWPSATLRVLGLPLAIYGALSSVTGLLGSISHARVRVESAVPGLALPVIFMLMVPLFYEGGMSGLNWLSTLPILKQLMAWPELKKPRRST